MGLSNGEKRGLWEDLKMTHIPLPRGHQQDRSRLFPLVCEEKLFSHEESEALEQIGQ